MSATDATSIGVIDDEERLCRSLSRLLRQAGFQPFTFLSAEEFLSSPKRHQFKCLLVDIRLGGLSGTDLHRQLLAEGDRTPVIYITAYDDPEARAEALDTHCAGFFLKTDPGAKIIETLRRVITSRS